VSLAALEQQLDPTVVLSQLVAEEKYEAAFNKALTLSEIKVVTWLCAQVDLTRVFATPPAISQMLLLALSQQLGCDLYSDSKLKLEWLRQALLALDPNDSLLATHMRPILDQLYANLKCLDPATLGAVLMRESVLVRHLVNSLLSECP